MDTVFLSRRSVLGDRSLLEDEVSTMVGFVSGVPVRVGCGRPVGVVCGRRNGQVVRSTMKMDGKEDGGLSNLMTQWTALTTFCVGLSVHPLMAEAAEDGGGVKDQLKTLFKTKAVSLAHPTAMWLLFGSAVFAFYLGNQVRELRTTKDSERKKELAKAKPGARHFNLTAGVLAAMTFFTFEGMVSAQTTGFKRTNQMGKNSNLHLQCFLSFLFCQLTDQANTFTRTGKLFPGPHLYNGLGLVTVMAFMSALVPQMQKGKGWARNTHYSLAVVALGLFGWQAQSGLQITFKLLGIK